MKLPHRETLREHYTIAGIGLTIIFQDKAAYQRTSPILRELSFLSGDEKNNFAGCRTLSVSVKTGKRPIPSSFITLMHSRRSNTKALRRGDTFIFTDEDSIFTVYPKEGNALLYPGVNTSYTSRFSFKQVVIGGLMELLRGCGFYPLHACGVANQGSRVLIIGNSGSGKSTVTLSLVLAGWNFLADDLLLLKERRNGIAAFSAETYLAFNSDLFCKSKNVVIGTNINTVDLLRGKERIIDVASSYPQQTVASFYPNAILFLEIINKRKSQISAISKRLALFKLFNQSVSIMLGTRASQGNLDALSRLLKQATPFGLLLGKDLNRNPLRVIDILSRALKPHLR